MPILIKRTGLEQFAPGGNARVKILVIGGPGAGKAADVDTPVATPTGWRRIGDITVGDNVLGSDGKPTEVLGVYPQGKRPMYRLTLNDGATVDVDGEHLWTVQTRKMRETGDRTLTLTTQQMIDRGLSSSRPDRTEGKPRASFYLPLAQPLQFENSPTAGVGPYLLGTLLANGAHTSDVVNFATNDEHVANRCIAENPHLDIAEATYATSTSRRWRIKGLHPILDALALDQVKSPDKHIPSQYLVADEYTRRELLAGLMDGDGSCGINRRATYHTTSPQLARDVQQLVWSLGGVARVTERHRNDGKPTEYPVSIWLPQNPFTLPRKAQRYQPNPWFRSFIKAEPVGEREAVCIKVAAADELFVIDNTIVTHNTRWSSFFPKPFYLDVEAGLASVADRNVPYATINNSQDMADALQFCKVESRKPEAARDFNTVVIDTLDAYQRKVKNEWMEAKRVDSFTGWEAWGFLTTRMQSLMTKLLNLDMNVIVNVHFKDKTTRDDETGRETHEFMLQLQGEIADTAYNDFDLVGWMDTEWAVVDGKRTLARWLSFQPTPQKPFLKDRLNLGADRLAVTFSDGDYKDLIGRITSKLDGLQAGGPVGEIPSYDETDTPNVVHPEQVGPSTLPPRGPQEAPLDQLDKATLIKVAKDEGVDRTPDGKPLRGNSLKSELVEAIKWARDHPQASPPVVRPPSAPAPAQPQAAPHRENAPAETALAPTERLRQENPQQQAAQPTKPQPAIKTPVGKVNPATGEILSSEDPLAVLQRLKDDYNKAASGDDESATVKAEAALESWYEANPEQASQAARRNVEDTLGATAIATTTERPRPKVVTPAPQAKSDADDKTCDVCGTNLANQNQQYVKLAWIKFRKNLCNADFNARVGKK